MNMFDYINWDAIFNYPIWQIIKWVFMVVVVTGLMLLLYDLNIHKGMLYDEKQSHEDTITAIRKVVYDTRANDKTLVKLITKYIEEKYK